MKSVRIWFFRLGLGLILTLSIVALSGLVFLSLTERGYIAMTTSEYIQFFQTGMTDGFYLIFLLTFLALLIVLSNYLTETQLFLLGAIAYLLIGGFLILNVAWLPRSDPRYVYEAAWQMNRGDFSNFAQKDLSSYLSIFPNQVGLVLLFRFYLMLGANIAIIWFFQLLMTIANQFLLWRITNHLFGNVWINKLLILFSFLFLPSLFLILWAYGDLPGLLGILLAWHQLQKFEQTRAPWHLLVVLFGLALALLVRFNYIIFLVALVCIYLLKSLQFFRKIFLLSVLTIGMAIALPDRITHLVYEKIEHQTIPQSSPMKAWVVMGLGTKAANPGYWDGYTTLLPIWYDFDVDQITERVDDDFNRRLSELNQEPSRWIDFFYRKIKVTWNESTYQSIYTGPLSAREQSVDHPLLENLYNEGDLYHVYNRFMHAYSLLIYMGALVYAVLLGGRLLKNDSIHAEHLLPLVYFIGGVIFHLFWETKSRYVYPYVFLMLPYVSIGSYSVIMLLKKIKDSTVKILTVRSLKHD